MDNLSNYNAIAADQDLITRRRKIAEAILQQNRNVPMGQMAGRFYVPTSPLQYAGALANQYVANENIAKADTEQKQLANRYQDEVAKAISQYEQTKSGTPERVIPPSTSVDELNNPMPSTTIPAASGNPRKAIVDAMMNPFLRNSPIVTADLKEMNDDKTRKIIQGEEEIHQERQPDGSWKEIGRGPRFAKQVGPEKDDKPIVVTDNAGNITLLDKKGNVIKKHTGMGKPTATFEKSELAKKKLKEDLDAIIPTLEAISKDGGLIDQSTGSGAGALVDMGAAFFGKATPGAVAVGKLQPMVDQVLKLVPRFEGPQSDKDTASYKEAAGNLSNPRVPNQTKKEAAKVILEIYKRRQGQFSTKDFESNVMSNPDEGWSIRPIS